ncbi:MAG: phosphotransferase enzyme family protein [Methylomicrobium sp.]
MTELLPIARQFYGSSSAVVPLGNGLINETYRVATDTEPFVLQCINPQVFPEPEAVLANLAEIGRHLEGKASGAVKLKIPRLLSSKAGLDHVRDEKGRIWRAISYLADTVSLESPGGLHEARQTGFALGHFHRLLSDLQPLRLKDTLPGFHIAPAYLARYREVLATVHSKRINSECAAFIERHQFLSDDLEAAKQQGLLPLRIIHGDPKLNNFLFDLNRQAVIGLVDLDTVKPGLLHYDIGDCLRSCCHRLENDAFDPDIGEAILASYLGEAGHFFTGPDYDYLYPAIRLLPFELGLRFYTDYLEGDRYFKVSEPEQNLQRALGQFRLCASILSQEQSIGRLIKSLRSKTAA